MKKTILIILTIAIILIASMGCTQTPQEKQKTTEYIFDFVTTEPGIYNNVEIQAASYTNFKVEVEKETILRITIYEKKFSISISENHNLITLGTNIENDFSSPIVYEYFFNKTSFYEIEVAI